MLFCMVKQVGWSAPRIPKRFIAQSDRFLADSNYAAHLGEFVVVARPNFYGLFKWKRFKLFTAHPTKQITLIQSKTQGKNPISGDRVVLFFCLSDHQRSATSKGSDSGVDWLSGLFLLLKEFIARTYNLRTGCVCSI